MMELDSFRNNLFSREVVAEKMSDLLLELGKKTVRDQLSLSAYDYEEIIASRKTAIDLVEKYFAMMAEQLERRRVNLLKFTGIKFISLGEDCLSRMLLTHWGLKPSAKLGEKSHPFDLAVHPIQTIIKLLETNFDGYLDPKNLAFNEARSTVSSQQFHGIHFNHEVGRQYAANNYQLLIETYKRRVANFYLDLSTHDKLVFMIHRDPPKHNMPESLNQLWHLLKANWPGKEMMLICVNTWPEGVGIDLTGREIIQDAMLKTIDAHYPYKGYVWHDPTHSLTETGYKFEKGLIDQITHIVSTWMDGFQANGNTSPPVLTVNHEIKMNEIIEKTNNAGHLIVKNVQSNSAPALMGFAVGHPQDNLLIDDKLIIAGWVIGKTSFADKIILSGGVSMELAVDIHRPDIQLTFGELIEGLCPLIDGIPRCGFYKELSLDELSEESQINVDVVLQDGRITSLTAITLSKVQSLAPKPVREPLPPKTKSFLKVAHQKKTKKRKKSR